VEVRFVEVVELVTNMSGIAPTIAPEKGTCGCVMSALAAPGSSTHELIGDDEPCQQSQQGGLFLSTLCSSASHIGQFSNSLMYIRIHFIKVPPPFLEASHAGVFARTSQHHYV